jgi:hypothetical protein
VGDTWKQILKEDYVRGSGIEPVSDPTMVSDMQRMGRAQFLLQFANDPMMDGKEIRHRVLAAADIENIDKLFAQNPAPNPAIAIKGMELDLKDKERADRAQLTKAQGLAALSTAIKNLADAEAVVSEGDNRQRDQHLEWLSLQLQAWQQQHSAETAPTKGADGSMKPGGEGPPPPQMAHPAALPGPSNNINSEISDDEMAKSDPDGNGRVSPSALYSEAHSGAM